MFRSVYQTLLISLKSFIVLIFLQRNIQGDSEISLKKKRELVMMRTSHRQKNFLIKVFSFSRHTNDSKFGQNCYYAAVLKVIDSLSW
jgi:hypothetical protein